MNKLKFMILILAVTLLTLFIGLGKPVMHKQTLLTDSDYVFVQESLPDTKIKAKNIDMTRESKQIKTSTVKTTDSQFKVDTTNQKTTAAPEKIALKKQNNQTTAAPSKKTNPSVENRTPVKVTGANNITSTQKVLTEREEIIVWNKWRSDLQNQVMKDTKISAPRGTGFKFSFTVDKFGNMSNINVWSTNPIYNDLAVRVIKPVLAGYQNKPVLNFPPGTKRIITNVTGGFVISDYTEFSTPSDYSDYEKVKRTN